MNKLLNKICIGAAVLCSASVISSCTAGLTYEEAPESVYSEVGVSKIELKARELFNDKMVEGTMGKWAPRFVNYISTIFIFILMSNISGLFGLRPPTADYGTTLALALITFFMIRFNKAKHQSAKDIWTGMCSPLPPWLPIWAPINIISEIAIPISLSLRLFANVLSGTVIMALVYGLLRFIAIAWPSVLHVYFDLFSGAIQTYVFCMLTMTYVTQACETDE